MNSFCCPPIQTTDSVIIQHSITKYARQEKDAQTTAFALGIITLLAFVAAFTLFGVGTLSPTIMNGLGMLPYFGGAAMSFLALGILTGALYFTAEAAIRTCQKEHYAAALA